jgi:hypothetical protein
MSKTVQTGEISNSTTTTRVQKRKNQWRQLRRQYSRIFKHGSYSEDTSSDEEGKILSCSKS